MFGKKCCKHCDCKCVCKKEITYPDNEVEITADYFKDGWMKDSNIRIRLKKPGKLSKLLAIRICNKLLEEVGIDFEISTLHYVER
jgi:hypothetical protein